MLIHIVKIVLCQLLFNFVNMRKLVVLFFLFIYLFSSTELSELLKVNVLFEHFAEHQAENKNISISTFLYMHYINHGKDNGDTKKDHKLPFHSDSNSVNSFVSVVFIPPFLLSIPQISITHNQESKSFYSLSKSLKSSYLASIWQPPQIV